MKFSSAVGGGFAGACALTVLHQTLKEADSNAPRMDLLGMNALSKILHRIGKDTPQAKELYYITMAGDIISNSLYYSLAGIGSKENVWLRGAALGLAAGAGAILLPKPLGLKERYSTRTAKTQVLAVGLYLFGGLVAAAVANLLEKRKEKKEAVQQIAW